MAPKVPTAAAHVQPTEKWDDVLRRLALANLVPHPLYRILLFGPPRTGKSSIARELFPKGGAKAVERVPIHKQLPVEDLLGGYALVNGTTVWQDGPAIRALRSGGCLVLDEIDQISPECRSILHALMDDPAGITLASGEWVPAAAGYCVIATTNAMPSSLPLAVLDRFDLVLLANSLSTGLRQSLGNLAIRADAVVSRDKSYNWTRPASVNLFLAAAKLRAKGYKDEEVVKHLGLYGQSAVDALIALRGV